MKSMILSAVISLTIGLSFQAQAQQAVLVEKVVISKIAQNAEAKVLLGLSAQATEAQVASALNAITNAAVRAQVVNAINSYASYDTGKLSAEAKKNLATKFFGKFQASQPLKVSLAGTSRSGLSAAVTKGAPVCDLRSKAEQLAAKGNGKVSAADVEAAMVAKVLLPGSACGQALDEIQNPQVVENVLQMADYMTRGGAATLSGKQLSELRGQGLLKAKADDRDAAATTLQQEIENGEKVAATCKWTI